MVKDIGTQWNRETRNTINDNDKSLQNQINNMSVGDGSLAELEQARVAADGTNYNTVKERLDTENNEVTSQLSEKANRTYVDNAIVESQRVIVDYQGSLADLNVDTNADMTKNYLILDNKDTTNYGYVAMHDGTNWVQGWKYQDYGIGEGEVTPKHTSFIDYVEKEEVTNEVDIIATVPRTTDIFIRETDGAEIANTDYTTTDFFSYAKGQKVFIGQDERTILSYAPIRFYDEAQTYISGYTPSVASESEQVEYNGHYGVYYVIPENTAYIRICISKNRLSMTHIFQLDVNVIYENLTIPNLNVENDLNSLHGKKIVNFGDSIFGNFRDETGTNISISSIISKRLNATVYNAGFGGCRMAVHSNFWNAFSMHALAKAINTGDWSEQDQAIIDGDGQYQSYFPETLDMLKDIDWNTIDVITIGYGTNDYSGNVFINESDSTFNYDYQYFKGATRLSIERILSAYPHIKVVLITPMWRWFKDENDNYLYSSDDVDSENTRGYILPDYVQAIRDVAKEYHVLYIENYEELGINKFNHLEYFPPTDGTHPNATGRTLRANNIASQLVSKL